MITVQAQTQLASRRRPRVGGFIAIDALTGLAILATTLALGLAAAHTAAQATARGAELRHLTTLAQMVLAGQTTEVGDFNGDAPRTHWALSVRPLAPTSAHLCQRSVRTWSTQDRTAVSLETVVPCTVRPS